MPRTDDEVGKGHHPSRGEADGAGKNRRGVGDFASSVGHRHHQLAVDPTDGKQQRAPYGEAKYCSQRTAAQEPVVHDDEPADAHHGPPAQGEVVGDAQFAGELGHG